MKVIVAALALAVSLSCASSGSVGTTATIYAEKTKLWLAAQAAIREMGGKIAHADEATGSVAGRIDVEGTPIDLSVSIWGSPASEATNVDYYDVDVRASLVGDPAPAEEWQRRLKFLADELMDRILAAATGSTRALPP